MCLDFMTKLFHKTAHYNPYHKKKNGINHCLFAFVCLRGFQTRDERTLAKITTPPSQMIHIKRASET